MANLVLGAGGGEAVDYTIDQSLRFNQGDSPRLSRTTGAATSTQKQTISVWVKRGDLGDYQYIIATRTSGGTTDNRDGFAFTSGDALSIRYNTDSGDPSTVTTTRLFRDVGSWYHIVLAVDTTQSAAADRVKIYVNGELETAFSTADYPSEDYGFSLNAISAYPTYISMDPKDSSTFYGGYLAEFYAIDGTQYAASDFGKTDSATNQWIPKDASGLTFGNNGFYQKYGDPVVRKTFTADATWTVPADITSVDYLVVGGAGGGGGSKTGIGSGGAGGGGGSGGYRTGTLSVTPAASLTVTIGDGGSGGTNDVQGSDGDDSVFDSITSEGGGGGGKQSAAGSDAPSGGGGGGGAGGSFGGTLSGGSGSTYGNDGGDAPQDKNAGGGGGGSAGAGGDASINTAGAAGAGTSNDITGSSVTYAAGGIGGKQDNHTNGAAGGANTGTGGGGGQGSGSTGGNGGSGIVVITYGAGFGADSSGEDNTFTVTNLVATDKMADSPTNNFCTFNPLSGSSDNTYSEGNLSVSGTGGSYKHSQGTVLLESGKWYWENYMGSTNTMLHGITDSTTSPGSDPSDGEVEDGYYYGNNGNKRSLSGTQTSYGASYTSGDIISTAIDLDSGTQTVTFYKNGSSQGSIDITRSTTWVSDVIAGDPTNLNIANFGQDGSFAGTLTAQGNQDDNSVGDFYYDVPAGYLALCTSNLDAPEIKLPGDNFNTVLYTGDGATTLAVTGVGFATDFLWIKNRDATDNNIAVDAVRGANNYLVTNTTAAEVDDSTFVASLDSDGFTVGDDVAVNTNTENYVSWNWLAADTFDPETAGTVAAASGRSNATAGFSIVEYTGESDPMTIGHGLSEPPELIIVKKTTGIQGWPTFHGTNRVLFFNATDTDGSGGDPGFWNATQPDASVFSVGNATQTSDPLYTYIAYCFHSVEGYSKIGSYEGNNNADGSFIYTGFKPAYVVIKDIDNTYDWHVFDDARDPYNAMYHYLRPSNAGVEGTTPIFGDFNSNGFKLRTATSGWNDSSTHIYMAFAESPFKYANAR